MASKTKTGVAVEKSTPKPRVIKTKVTAEQIEQILDLISLGNSERAACREVKVDRNTFRHAALKHNMASQYAYALETLAQDQINKIEQVLQDARTKKLDVNVARLEIDTRKWFASKLLPRKYGNQVDVTSDGKQLPAPILNFIVNDSSDTNLTTTDINEDIIDGEVPENTAQYQPKPKRLIMDDINAI